MTAQPQAVYAAPVCPFKWLYRRAPGKAGAKANVADFREGYLQFDPEGIIIQAKAVPRAEIRAWVLVPCVLLSLLIAVVANSIMEYAMRSDQRLGVRWDSIKEILLSPDKQQACLVYDAPNYKGNIKTFTLAFTPAPGYYEMLVQAARQYAPGQIAEGRFEERNAAPRLDLFDFNPGHRLRRDFICCPRAATLNRFASKGEMLWSLWTPSGPRHR